MLAHQGCASATQRRRILRQFKRLSPAWACLLLAGCVTAPSTPVSGAHPADREAHARPAAYRPVIDPYVSRRPRNPSGWLENNERVAPQEKP